MNEQFSAFLDGEATRDEADAVVNALLRDEKLRESWSRQHWLRTTLRAHSAETAPALDAGFSARVMAEIAADDPHERPAAPADRGDASSLAAEPGGAMGGIRIPARGRPPWRHMAGMAVAASAAGIVLLVSNPWQNPGVDASQTVAGDAGVSPMVAPAGAVSQPAGSEAADRVDSEMLREAGPSEVATQRGPSDHWSVSDPDLEDELNSYLVEHNGLSRGYGMSGTTPGFVRVATYGQDSPR